MPGIGPATAEDSLRHACGCGELRCRALAEFACRRAPPRAWAGLRGAARRARRRRRSGLAGRDRARRGAGIEPQLERLLRRRRVRGRPTSSSSSGSPAASPSRERFLTELTLDPPQRDQRPRRGAAAGRGLPDPVDHPFGQGPGVGRSVFVLNVRRRLHPLGPRHRHAGGDRGGAPAALRGDDARATTQLSLIVPQRFHVTQQRRDGDRHVYGARSRFIPERLLSTFTPALAGRAAGPEAAAGARGATRIDVAAKLRDMW